MLVQHELIKLFYEELQKNYNYPNKNFFYDDFNRQYQDILPYVLFRNDIENRIRPFCLNEFANILQKDNYFPFKSILVTEFVSKWKDMNISISRNLIVDLIHVLHKYYFVESLEEFISFKECLNDWSKNSLCSNFGLIANAYIEDLRILLSDKEFELLTRIYSDNNNQDGWFLDDICEIYKFYSISVELELDNQVKHFYIFELLMDVMFENDFKKLNAHILAILLHCLRECPDQIVQLNKLKENYQVKSLILKESDLLNRFKNILDLASEDNKKDIQYILDCKNSFSEDSLHRIKKIYARYDNEVRFTIHDHNQELTDVSKEWIYLAKLLTAFNYFNDYLELLCPTLDNYLNKVTGLSLSCLDLRYFLFSEDRKYLVNLFYSRDLYKVLGMAFDCNTSNKIRYLGYDEIKQISGESCKFHEYYKYLSKKQLNIPQFNFISIIALQRLITNTSFLNKNDNFNYIFTVNSDKNIVNSYYNYFNSIVVIHVSCDKNILYCKINFSNSKYINSECCIYESELSKRLITPLTSENFKPHQKEILYLLRMKRCLPYEYNKKQERKILKEYELFNCFYNNLNDNERNILNGTVVKFNDRELYFKEIYLSAKYDICDANMYLKVMLQNIYPSFLPSINNKPGYFLSRAHVEYKHSKIVLKDLSLEIDKIFVSLVTHYFVPEESIPNKCLHYKFLDTAFVFPMHQYLYWLFDSFNNYYAEINDSDVYAQYKFIYENFYKHLYPQIDKYYLTGDFEGGFFEEIYNWILKVVNGEIFKVVHIFEPEEVLEIITIIHENILNPSETLKNNISIFFGEVLKILQTPEKINNVIINIKLIKFLAELSRYQLKTNDNLNYNKLEKLTIYLGSDLAYTVCDANGVLNRGILPKKSFDLDDFVTRINELEIKKKILKIIARAGHISLAENDFPKIFKIIYNNEKVNIHCKNLLKMFLLAEGIEQTSDEGIKTHIIDMFNLNSSDLDCNTSKSSFSKLTAEIEIQGDLERKRGMYSSVHENFSSHFKKDFSSEVDFSNKYKFGFFSRKETCSVDFSKIFDELSEIAEAHSDSYTDSRDMSPIAVGLEY